MEKNPITHPRFLSLHAGFAKAITVKRYNAGSIAMYSTCLREFLSFCERRGLTQVAQVKAVDIIAYYEHVKDRPNQRRAGTLSESMIRHHLLALRMFFDYLVDTGELSGTPVHLPRFLYVRSTPRIVLTVEEIRQLYAACENRRDKALMAVAYGCGLRRSEIHKLDITDVLLQKGCLVVRDGKNHKNRTVPLSDNVVADLRNYLVMERHKAPAGTVPGISYAFFCQRQRASYEWR